MESTLTCIRSLTFISLNSSLEKSLIISNLDYFIYFLAPCLQFLLIRARSLQHCCQTVCLPQSGACYFPAHISVGLNTCGLTLIAVLYLWKNTIFLMICLMLIFLCNWLQYFEGRIMSFLHLCPWRPESTEWVLTELILEWEQRSKVEGGLLPFLGVSRTLHELFLISSHFFPHAVGCDRGTWPHE